MANVRKVSNKEFEQYTNPNNILGRDINEEREKLRIQAQRAEQEREKYSEGNLKDAGWYIMNNSLGANFLQSAASKISRQIYDNPVKNDFGILADIEEYNIPEEMQENLFDSINGTEYHIELEKIKQELEWRKRAESRGFVGNLTIEMLADPMNLAAVGFVGVGTKLAAKSSTLYGNYLARNATRGAIWGAEFAAWDYLEGQTRAGYDNNPLLAFGLGAGLGFAGGSVLDGVRRWRSAKNVDPTKTDEVKIANKGDEIEQRYLEEQERVKNIDIVKSQKVNYGAMTQKVLKNMNELDDEYRIVLEREERLQKDINQKQQVIDELEKFIKKTPDSSEVIEVNKNITKLQEQNKKLQDQLNDIKQNSITKEINKINNTSIPDQDLDIVSSIAARNESSQDINRIQSEVDDLRNKIKNKETFRDELSEDYRRADLLSEEVRNLNNRVENPNKTDINKVINNTIKQSKTQENINNKALQQIKDDIKIQQDNLIELNNRIDNTKRVDKRNELKREVSNIKRKITNLNKELDKPSKKRINRIEKEYAGNLRNSPINIEDARRLNKKELSQKSGNLQTVRERISSNITKTKTFKNLDTEIKNKLEQINNLNRYNLNPDRLKKITKQKTKKLSGKKIPESALEDYAKILIKRRYKNQMNKNQSRIGELRNRSANNEILDDVINNVNMLKKQTSKTSKRLNKMNDRKRNILEKIEVNKKAYDEVSVRNKNEFINLESTHQKLKNLYIKELRQLEDSMSVDDLQTNAVFRMSPEYFGDLDSTRIMSDLQFERMMRDVPDDINYNANRISEDYKRPEIGSDGYFEIFGVKKKDFTPEQIDEITRVGYSIWREDQSSVFTNTQRTKANLRQKIQDENIKGIDPNARNIDETITDIAEKTQNPKSIYGVLKVLKDFGELVGTDKNPILRGLGNLVMTPISDVTHGQGVKTIESLINHTVQELTGEWNRTVKGIFLKARKNGVKEATKLNIKMDGRFKRKAMNDAGEYIRDERPNKREIYHNSDPYWEMVADLGDKIYELNGRLVQRGIDSGHEFFYGMDASKPNFLTRVYRDDKIIDILTNHGQESLERLFRVSILNKQPDLLTKLDADGKPYIDKLSKSMSQIISDNSQDRLQYGKFLSGNATLEDALFFIRDQLQAQNSSALTDADMTELLRWNRNRKLKSESNVKTRMLLDENIEITSRNKRGEIEVLRFNDIIENNAEKIFQLNLRQMTGKAVQGDLGIKTNGFWAEKLKQSLDIENRDTLVSKSENAKRNTFISDMFYAMEATANGRPVKDVDYMNTDMSKIIRVFKQYAVAVYLGRSYISYFVEYAKRVAMSPSTGIRDVATIIPKTISSVFDLDKTFDPNTLQEVSKNRFIREIESVFGEQRVAAEIPVMQGRNNPTSLDTQTGWLDKADFQSKRLASFSQVVNDAFERNMRISTYEGVIQNFTDMANSRSGKVRFNKAQIQDSGLSEARLNEVADALVQYTRSRRSFLLKDSVYDADLRRFKYEQPELFNDFRYAANSIVDTIILRPKNSRRQPWLSSPYMDLLMIFRTFSLQALSQDLFRYASIDKRAGAANTMAMATMGMGVYAAQIYVNSMGKKPEERQEFLDEYLKPDRIAMGGVGRVSSFGLGLPAFDAAFEYGLGVDPYFGNNIRSSTLSTGLIEGNPAVQIGIGYKNLGQSAFEAARFGENFSQRDFDNSFGKITPWQNVPGMIQLMNSIKFNLPEADLDRDKIKERHRKRRSIIDEI